MIELNNGKVVIQLICFILKISVFKADFFKKLTNHKQIGHIPLYLSHALKVLGFDSAGSFASLSEEDYESVYEAINQQVRKLDNKPENDPVRVAVTSELEDLDQTILLFEIPMGHKKLVKSIHHHFNQIRPVDLKKQQVSSSKEKPKAEIEKKIKEQAFRAIKENVHASYLNIEHEVLVQENDGEWTIQCPICESKTEVSVYVQMPRGKCVISNFTTHLRKKHKIIQNKELSGETSTSGSQEIQLSESIVQQSSSSSESSQTSTFSSVSAKRPINRMVDAGAKFRRSRIASNISSSSQSSPSPEIRQTRKSSSVSCNFFIQSFLFKIENGVFVNDLKNI